MKQVKLSSLKDGQPFIISLRRKTVYTVTKKYRTGVLVTATESQKTYTKPKDLLVYKA